jgi:hypothetical protein
VENERVITSPQRKPGAVEERTALPLTMPLLMVVVFSFTLFFSAAMLFLVEPLVGKMMLPLLGGTPAVWNTCMVFFQAVLLAGYGYAHASSHWLGARKQAVLHLVILALPVPLLLFVFRPGTVLSSLIAGAYDRPIQALLLALTVVIGLPMFAVSASAPLLQKWFSNTNHPSAKDPYFLYAASNVGSLLALLSYPTLVEPTFTLASQRLYWSVGFLLLAVLTAGCAFLLWRSPPALEPAPGSASGSVFAAAVNETGIQLEPAPARAGDSVPPEEAPEEGPREEPVTFGRRLRWIACAFVPSSLMLGVTAHVTMDLAPIPLLWVLPLALYLLSFVIVFARIPPLGQALLVPLLVIPCLGAAGWWMVPRDLPDGADVLVIGGGCFVLWAVLTILLVLRAVLAHDRSLIHKSMVLLMPLLVLRIVFMYLSDSHPGILGSIALHLVTLFVVCMVCHGEIARDRPPARYLTGYFLLLSLGGVLGGLFNALVAPLIFSGIVEYPLALACACLLLPGLFTWRSTGPWRRARWGAIVLSISLGVGLVLGGALLLDQWRRDHRDQLKSLVANRDEVQKEYEEEKEHYQKAFKHIKGFDFDKVSRGREYAATIERSNERIKEMEKPASEILKTGPWQWTLVAIGIALFLGAGAWWTDRRAPPNEDGSPAPNHWLDRVLDIALPLALALFVVGLYWGLPSERVAGHMKTVADFFGFKPARFRNILTYGLPAVLCLFFVNRSLRFGLAVGATLLAGAYCNHIDDSPVFHGRSFFGVLKVQERGSRYSNSYALRLVHGSTLHGKQFVNNVYYRHQPLTYYHRTGPVGLVFEAYNRIDRPVGVIGLGAGTMSCYGLVEATMKVDKTVDERIVTVNERRVRAGFDMVGDMKQVKQDIVEVHRRQKMTFYEIDPLVIQLSGPGGKYFKYVDDSIAKGGHQHHPRRRAADAGAEPVGREGQVRPAGGGRFQLRRHSRASDHAGSAGHDADQDAGGRHHPLPHLEPLSGLAAGARQPGAVAWAGVLPHERR